jgi:hypothetical protein
MLCNVFMLTKSCKLPFSEVTFLTFTTMHVHAKHSAAVVTLYQTILTKPLIHTRIHMQFGSAAVQDLNPHCPTHMHLVVWKPG